MTDKELRKLKRRDLLEILYDQAEEIERLEAENKELKQRLDERIQGTESFPDRAAAWTKDGVVQAVGIILTEKNTLFDSLIDKVNRYPDLRECLYAILMKGSDMSYSPDIETIDVAQMYGFVKIVNSKVVIANRIFETRLYNFFLLSEEANRSERDSFGR